MLNYKPSKDFQEFCASFKNSYDDLGWPNPRLESWKLTNVNKFISDTSKLLTNDRCITFSHKNKEIIKNLNVKSLNLLKSDFFKNHEMSRVILSNINNGFEISLPDNFNSKENIEINSKIKLGSWNSSVFIIKIGKNVSAKLSFDFSLSSNSICTPLIAFEIGENSNISFGFNVVNESDNLNNSNYIALMNGKLMKNSTLNSLVTQQGVNLSRSEININLVGDYSSFNLVGLYFGRQKHHKDITTSVNHLAEHTSSKQIVRGILDDSAVGVYQGGIKVSNDAQKTDGKQMSRALLLSKLAESNSKPELEIFADDVSCSHGATIGELNKDQLFYLLSRGLPFLEARQILIRAYLNEILEEIYDEDLIKQLNKAINMWLKQLQFKDAA